MTVSRNNILIVCSFLSVGLIYSCSPSPGGDKAITSERKEVITHPGIVYSVDTMVSVIHFTGRGVGKNHPGTFKLLSGKLEVSNHEVRSGTFIVGINSLQLDETDKMVQNKLRPHLLSEDFLDANKYPVAEFEITSVQPFDNKNDSSIVKGANYLVSGNLKLKDIIKNISFPAQIDINENTLKSTAAFNIDRTNWKINYHSEKSLGDKFISEQVNIRLSIIARNLSVRE